MRGARDPNEVKFSVKAETTLGSQIRVVGSIEKLGCWNPDCALTLGTDASTYPTWSVLTALPSQSDAPDGIDYKFVKCFPDGTFIWEERSNRRLCHRASGWISPSTPEFGDSTDPPPPTINDAVQIEGCTMGKTTLKHSGTDPEPSPKINGAAQIEGDTNGKNAPMQLGTTSIRFRSSSSPNLLMAPMNDEPTESTSSLARHGLPSANEDQSIKLSVRGAAQIVEVVFESDGSRQQLRRATTTEKLHDQSSAQWMVPFKETGLKSGMHTFHFLVDGARALSSDHPVHGGSNMALFSGTVRSYIIATSTGQDELQSLESPRWDRACSAGLPGIHNEGQIARPRSIGTNLLFLGGDESENGETDAPDMALHSKVQFPPEIFEGLFDRELRLRLYGCKLPEASDPKQRLRLSTGAHRLKKPFGECEDAYFVDDHALGIADGVGGMAQFKDYGVNSAHYAEQLMECAMASLLPGVSAAENGAPRSVEQRALAACCAAEKDAQGFGASTIGVLVLENDTVGYSNLGDSGFMVLRQGADGIFIVKRSEEQQHGWNCPFQLTRLPAKLIKRFPKLDQDHATQCMLYSLKVCDGDLLILYSDGLIDNIHDHEIVDIVNCALSPAFAALMGLPERSTPAQNVAKALAMAAKVRSCDQLAKVPFYHYSKKHGYDCPGGKEDDITVLAAWVVPDDELEETN